MDMDAIFHIHGNPANNRQPQPQTLCRQDVYSYIADGRASLP